MADIVMTEENAAPATKWYTEPATTKQIEYAAINDGGVAACHFEKAQTTGWRDRFNMSSQSIF
jgi:hypothetical protein